jgi:hypothetical protein
MLRVITRVFSQVRVEKYKRNGENSGVAVFNGKAGKRQQTGIMDCQTQHTVNESITRAFAQVRFARDLVEEVVPVPAPEEYDRTPSIDIMVNKMAKNSGQLDEEMVQVCQA